MVLAGVLPRNAIRTKGAPWTRSKPPGRAVLPKRSGKRICPSKAQPQARSAGRKSRQAKSTPMRAFTMIILCLAAPRGELAPGRVDPAGRRGRARARFSGPNRHRDQSPATAKASASRVERAAPGRCFRAHEEPAGSGRSPGPRSATCPSLHLRKATRCSPARGAHGEVPRRPPWGYRLGEPSALPVASPAGFC